MKASKPSLSRFLKTMEMTSCTHSSILIEKVGSGSKEEDTRAGRGVGSFSMTTVSITLSSPPIKNPGELFHWKISR